ncbi:hypothetical protein Leryth_002245 [Lithospermum erythrorhizon]|nr:hypothetical protein Leryth_002245 [Lithospermum erythrorhizon]
MQKKNRGLWFMLIKRIHEGPPPPIKIDRYRGVVPDSRPRRRLSVRVSFRVGEVEHSAITAFVENSFWEEHLLRRKLSSGECMAANPIDKCWRCDPKWATNRKRLANCARGFGRGVTGGKDGAYYIVTDPSERYHSICDKTIDGRGVTVRIAYGVGFTMQSVQNRGELRTGVERPRNLSNRGSDMGLRRIGDYVTWTGDKLRAA